MNSFTYVELFAGAGGLSRGLEMAGWECVAHAEWDAHARAVLRRHWPNTPLFGDVSTLTGQMIAEASGGRPVTMLTGGSPCQDLSIAGKRAGMTEDSGTRSSLYFDQVRLWHELDAISPCPYLLWENVLGAFSSNNGRDFAAVLSALVGTPVAVPEDGWKGGGGVVSGSTGVAAWRVLDCQYFGHNGRDTVPQRRRRVFVLGVRAGGVDPAEVLSLLDRLSGDFESGGTARQGTAPDAGASAASSGGDDAPTSGTLTPWDSQSRRVHAATGVWPTLSSATNSGQQQPAVFDAHTQYGGVAGSLTARHDSSPCADRGQNVVLAFHATQDPISSSAVTPRLGVTAGSAAVYDARGNGAGSVDTTLRAGTGGIGDYTPVVMRQREGKPGGGKGPLVSDKSLSLTGHNDQTVFAVRTAQTSANGHGIAENVAHTMDGANGQAVVAPPTSSDQVLFTKQQYGAYEATPSVASRLGARDHASQHTDLVLMPTVRPRRLLPIETERLMGWPDEWTQKGINEQGKEYALSDSARHKLCGNGVASPVAAWIGWRLHHTVTGK